MRVHSRPWTKVHHLRPRDANPEVPFRPRGFSPPRRVSPRKGSQACCILQPTLGFATFHTDQPKPAAIPATRPPLEGFSHPLVALRSPGALAPLAFALADPYRPAIAGETARLVTRPAPSRHCPRGWSVTFGLLAERERPVLPGLLSPLRGRRRPRGRSGISVTGEAGTTRPPSLFRANPESDWRGTAVDGPEPANRNRDLLEVWDVKERSEEHSPRSGPEHRVISGAPVIPFRVSRDSKLLRLTPRHSHGVHLERAWERCR